MYSYDLPPIIKRNLPVALRKARALAWLKNLTMPLAEFDIEFQKLRGRTNEKYDWNGLIHSMEWQLNDRFDPILRRIYIVVHDTPAVGSWVDDYETGNHLWIDDHEMSSIHWMDTVEYNAIVPINYEFTVRVWIGISIDLNEVIEIVDRYRFAGLRARVVWLGEIGEIEPEIPEFNPG